MALCLGLIVHSFVAQAINVVTVKKETPQYMLDMKYPQGFQSKDINLTIKSFIADTQGSFLKELTEDANTPADAPGKTSLHITYSLPYESKSALSVRFNISIFHRGAAHPSNHVTVVNFVMGHQVKLSDLFISGMDYLNPISKFCAKELISKSDLDTHWIQEGTKPTAGNYRTWYFTAKGIAVVFDSYQVAAYVYGEQSIGVPLSQISTMIKPEFFKIVWGN